MSVSVSPNASPAKSLPRKKLLIIGAGDFQLPLVEQAAKSCEVLLAAPVISAAFEPYISDRLIVDVRDEEAILAFARAHKIDGVITDQTDIAVRSVAYVAENMGLPGIGCETGILFTDKSRMRTRLAELGIPQLANRTVSSVEDACAFYQELCGAAGESAAPVRVIIKPLDTQGSRGVQVCAGEEELRDKYDILPKNLRWHMIGNLQRNKVKYVVGRAVMIHSLGSDELAESIEKEAEKKDLIMPVLAEVNMAGESSKSGLAPEETEAFLRRVSSMKHLKVKGLMTIAPMTEFPEENRVYFRELRNLAVDIARKNIDNVDMYELSMGMTGDFEVAIEEGATMVRVGTGIFGARNYGAL